MRLKEGVRSRQTQYVIIICNDVKDPVKITEVKSTKSAKL